MARIDHIKYMLEHRYSVVFIGNKPFQPFGLNHIYSNID